VPIVVSSIVPTLIATLVFFLLEKYTRNGWKIFKIIALVLMIITFVNPFIGIQGVTVGYAVVLDLMHVVVVGSLFYFIGKAVKKNSSN
jgi:energy-coupling factor transporter transmembrane protein EcfT